MSRAAPRASWSGSAGIACVLAVAMATNGCRSCAEDRAAPAPAPGAEANAGPAQPAMPPGMLMGSDGAGGGTGAATDGGGLRVARGVKGGAWTELQIARPGDRPDRADFEHWRDDSWFVPLEAMTQMHEAFARALPGFDLFLPRLFDPHALALLGGELEAFAARASGDLAATARELAQIARSAAAKGQSLWVLGL